MTATLGNPQGSPRRCCSFTHRPHHPRNRRGVMRQAANSMNIACSSAMTLFALVFVLRAAEEESADGIPEEEGRGGLEVSKSREHCSCSSSTFPSRKQAGSSQGPAQELQRCCPRERVGPARRKRGRVSALRVAGVGNLFVGLVECRVGAFISANMVCDYNCWIWVASR
eukprot:125006-Pyramimonas_sp.AAC.1